MRPDLGRAKRAWSSVLPPTSSLPVASEECDLVKAEAQGFFSNIQCFSALLLISLASLDAEEDWGKCRFADKEGNDDFRVLSCGASFSLRAWPQVGA